MLSNELEYCLNDAFHRAREARHEYLTVEHLLLGILDTPKVREILRACGADLTKLKQDLKDHIDQSTPHLEEAEEREVQPTLGFQRVLQRAVFHVQSISPTAFRRSPTSAATRRKRRRMGSAIRRAPAARSINLRRT